MSVCKKTHIHRKHMPKHNLHNVSNTFVWYAVGMSWLQHDHACSQLLRKAFNEVKLWRNSSTLVFILLILTSCSLVCFIELDIIHILIFQNLRNIVQSLIGCVQKRTCRLQNNIAFRVRDDTKIGLNLKL